MSVILDSTPFDSKGFYFYISFLIFDCDFLDFFEVMGATVIFSSKLEHFPFVNSGGPVQNSYFFYQLFSF